jgi:NADP-dependent 3-hydroxy acid dehydrogenase YdfG
MEELAGQTAIVTGASRGIGLETSRALAGAGARLGLLSRRQADLDELAKALDGSAIAVECDVTDRASVAAAAARLREAFGGAPNIIVNNAGFFHVAPLHAMKPENFVATISTNLVGTFLVLHEFLAEMRDRGSGHVVTIGSAGDRQVFAENGAYSAAKFGLRGMHQVLRTELGGTGVRVTLVSPSSVDTALWDGLNTESEDSAFPSRSKMLSPADVARVVLFAVTQPATVNIDELRLSRS